MNDSFFRIKMSFTKKMLLFTISLILLVCLFISGILYKKTVDASEELEMILTLNSAENVQANIQTVLDSTQNYITQIVHMEPLRIIAEQEEILNEKTIEPVETLLENEIENILFYNAVSDTLTIEFVSIYLVNGFSYFSLPDIELPFNDYNSCYTYLLNNDYIIENDHIRATWYETIEIKNASGVSTRCCVGSRFLYDAITMQKVGIIITGINENKMCDLYNAGFPDGYIIQNTNSIISANNKSIIGTKINIGKDDFKILRSPASDNGTIKIKSLENASDINSLFYKLASYNIFLIVPLKNGNIMHDDVISKLIVRIIFIAICSIIIGVIMAIMISKKLLDPILSLKKVVQKVQKGDLSARFIPSSNDEIAYLGEHFNDMLDQIENFIRAQKQDALQKKDLEIRLLQSQINPHLLYNALNSVALAVKCNDMKKAEQLLYALSNFFRFSLSEGRDLITIEEELSILDNYIIIQNIGRKMKIKIIKNVQKELLNYKILRLTLQPLIENAVLHGFSGYREDGEIQLKAKVVNNTNIELYVIDNGIGIEPDTLLEINKSINNKRPIQKQKYFGLFNINRRLKNHFGEEYGIKINSEIGGYTMVRIVLPYKN